MTEQPHMPSTWWHDFWEGWFTACSGRADEEHAHNLASEHYASNRDRSGAVVAAELYALDPLPPLETPSSTFFTPLDKGEPT